MEVGKNCPLFLRIYYLRPLGPRKSIIATPWDLLGIHKFLLCYRGAAGWSRIVLKVLLLHPSWTQVSRGLTPEVLPAHDASSLAEVNCTADKCRASYSNLVRGSLSQPGQVVTRGIEAASVNSLSEMFGRTRIALRAALVCESKAPVATD